ncbi:MAG: CAP domain-containing protein [Negativicutes bacterium]|nr:CAP domain-containing protein [Negativicutes bacterium]
MGKGRFILIFLVLLLTMIVVPMATGAAQTLSFSLSISDGDVTTSLQPFLALRILDRRVILSDIKITLDGSQVAAAFDKSANFAWYVPNKPLATGNHVVKFTIFSPGYKPTEASIRFTVVSGGPAPAIIDNEVTAAIAAANDWRAEAGLAPLQANYNLTVSAQRHANYLYINNGFSHFEDPGKPGFSGKFVRERAMMAGFVGLSVDEVGTSESWPVEAAVRRLADAPYHRLAFMDPNLQFVGAGVNWDTNGQGTASVFLEMAAMKPAADDRIMVYPYPGQTNAPIAWQDFEIPSPLRFSLKQTGAMVGYPVSVSIHDDQTAELRTVYAQMTDEKGGAVPVYIVDSSLENDKVFGQDRKTDLILIPKKPLTPGTRYSVQVKLIRVLVTGETQPREIKWSFATDPVFFVRFARIVSLNGTDYFQALSDHGDVPDLTYFLSDHDRLLRVVRDGQHYSYSGEKLPNGVYRLEVFSKIFGQAKVFEAVIDGPPEKRQVKLRPLDEPPRMTPDASP